jgi:hypothetical protein
MGSINATGSTMTEVTRCEAPGEMNNPSRATAPNRPDTEYGSGDRLIYENFKNLLTI